MVQFKLLSGKMAGTTFVARHFPWQIGRAPEADCRLEEPGVWDRHLVIDLKPAEGFTLVVQPNACVILNGQPAQDVVLRNGDLIEIGSLKLQFELTPNRQRSSRGRECFTWLTVALITVLEAWLMVWLTR
jgi:pSer/pThr/pTyr-binding forkhead associated (FHA) protein